MMFSSVHLDREKGKEEMGKMRKFHFHSLYSSVDVEHPLEALL